MAGYYGYSMSNNAVDAYNDGEKPISKWTKSEILAAIKAENLNLSCSFEQLRKAPVRVLKRLCLVRSSWHHTSCLYNKTDFYSVDYDAVENITAEMLDAEISAIKTEITQEPTEEKWRCAFLEWSGTRKHPKATEHIEIGIVKGNWFYREDGSKKKTNANGFRFIEKIEN